MLNITSSSLLAIHLAILIGSQTEKIWKLPELSEWLQKPSNTLSKILQQLVRQDFLASVKGPSGGFKLLRPASSIRLIEILEAMQGPLKTCSCMLDRKKCLFDVCMFRDLTQQFPLEMKRYLEQTNLEQAIQKQFSIKKHKEVA